MLFEIDGEFKVADYIDGIIVQFGPENAKTINPRATINLGQKAFSGQIVRIDIGGQLLTQEAYALPVNGGRGRLLVIQDSLTDAGQHSDEYMATLKPMKESFKLK